MSKNAIKYTLQINTKIINDFFLDTLFHYLINQYLNLEIEVFKKIKKSIMRKKISFFNKNEYKKSFFGYYHFYCNKQNIDKIIEQLLSPILIKGCAIYKLKKQIFYFFAPLNNIYLNCYNNKEVENNKIFLKKLIEMEQIESYEIYNDETELEEPEWLLKSNKS